MKYFIKGKEIFLRLFAGIVLSLLFFGVVVFLCTVISSVSAQEPVSSSSVFVGVVIPFNKKACDKDPAGNWYTTLSLYESEEGMLSAMGYTAETFAEYCQTLPK